jgi:aromatic-L-amino-acid decarboxylase
MDFTPTERKALWNQVIQSIEHHLETVGEGAVAPPLDINEIRAFIKEGRTPSAKEAIDHVVNGMTQYMLHTTHPGYFGLYNPKASFAGILGDTLTAAFNPQLAAWSHSPFALEVERMLLMAFGKRFGYAEDSIDGTFCSGGAEANHTALLAALNHHFPQFASEGLIACQKPVAVYCSAQVHHSITKAAGVCGLGYQSVREISTIDLEMDVEALEQQIKEDEAAGITPLMVVATMGTTGTGNIDPIERIYALKEKYGFWLHADGAYGGALIVSQIHRSLLKGIEHADSITFDAHKWLSVPMGGSLFITRHPDILSQTFSIKADYMPKEAQQLGVVDPFAHSLQWSRRFIGLKLYMALLFYGWEGFEQLVNGQIAKGKMLREKLVAKGWTLYNQTDLPVITFGNSSLEQDPNKALEIVQKVIQKGNNWISVYNTNGINAIRACITNYDTSELEMNQLLADLTESK